MSFQKPTGVYSVNITAITKLAGVTEPNDDLSKLVASEIGDGEIGEALKLIRNEERAKNVREAALEVQKLLTGTDDTIATTVQEIRNIRRREAFLLDKLSGVNKAKAYGLTTMNFLPLVSALTGDGLHTVPANFVADKPKTVSKVAKPAAAEVASSKPAAKTVKKSGPRVAY